MQMQPHFARHLTLIFITLYTVLAFYVMAVFMVGGEFGGLGPRSVNAMVNGNALRPNVYRVLVPTIIRTLVAVTPQGLEDAASNALMEIREGKLMRSIIRARYAEAPNSLAYERIYKVTIAHMVVAGFLGGYLFFLYRLAALLFPQSRAYALFAPVFALLLLPALSYKFAYIYDYSGLMLLTASFFYLARREWRAYLVCFFLATLNRETSIYILFFFAVYTYGKMEQQRYVRMIAAQLAIFAALKIAINAYYIDNMGDGIIMTLFGQLSFLFTGYSVSSFLGILMIFFLITFRWPEKPELLRYGVWLFPALSAAYVLVGWPMEYRHFYELTPVAILLATHTLVKLAGFDTLELFAPRQAAEI